MATKHQKFELSLKGYTEAEREAIAIEVIDQIVKRTKSGKDKNGDAFAKYSKSYKDSQNFKIAGKGSSVDLTLSGDMLDSIQVLANRSAKVVIGFENGTTENGKADGNIRGTYGQSSPVGPARDFLGISESELKRILSKYPKGTRESEIRAQKRLEIEKKAKEKTEDVETEEL